MAAPHRGQSRAEPLLVFLPPPPASDPFDGLSPRHGGEWNRISKLSEDPVADGEAEQTVIIHDLLDHLGTTHPRQVEVAKMRMFLQLTFSEIAEVLGLSADTTESDWNFARAWLKREWVQIQPERST